MTQEEIIEYNKRCAEFLNIKTLLTSSQEILYSIEDLPEITIPVGSSGINATIQTGLLKAGVNQLVFHSNWNWIKSVLEKILSLNEDDFSDKTQQAFENLLDLSLFSSKESVCESINNFIKTIK